MIDHFEYITEPQYFGGLDTIHRDEMSDVYRCSIYENIEERSVAGEDMIFIPKVYVAHRLNKGKNPSWFISDHPREGYHLHPAFFNNGVETPNGILIGKYPASIEKNDGSYCQGNDATYGLSTDSHDLISEEVTDAADIHSWAEDWATGRFWYYHSAETFAACIALKNSDPSGVDTSGWHLFNIYEVI